MDLRSVRSRSWWVVTIAGLKGLLTASVLVVLYYLLPLDFSVTDAPAVVKVALGAVVFLGLMTWQVRAIVESTKPGLRALQGVFVAVPLFLLTFATAYYLMSRADVSNFPAPLSRTDALYFTVTVFSTVGFGDISPQTETARLVVTGQMILDLALLGLGVRVLLEAVQRGRDRLGDEPGIDPGPQ